MVRQPRERLRVGLFITCLNDALHPDTGKAVVRLLTRLGCEVDFPAAQSCCGQMHFNTGYRREAAALARKWLDEFAGYDAIVVPSASCAGMPRESFAVIAESVGDAQLAADARRVGPRVYELSEFLMDVLGVTDVGAYFPYRVTYHPTCHSLRALKVGSRPYQLLAAVEGLEFVELPAAEECCGFGGTFAVKNGAVSGAMNGDKARHAVDSGAEVLCALDNSCLMNIDGRLRRDGEQVRTLHLAEILASTREDDWAASA